MGEGWIAAKDLRKGDLFETDNGKKLAVDEIIKKKQKATVYNFKVKDFHTYYVSNLKVLTHNECKVFDVVNYRPSSSPLENHHGVLDVWAKHNVPDYKSRGSHTPTIALTKDQHNATKSAYRDWLEGKTGKRVGGKVNWNEVSPREMQGLSERMFDAANVPRDARQNYYNAFNSYNYR
ncbi:putative ribonuclease toxin of YeeF-YezG toxin-antitoxin module [Croceifilum oryzae]|uniref:Ribonuclease toxin of YeeF-YezG toxin-antitoxin module n=1 Tax=Croceifilum oryzae TaxID=1553429 RepID=A0AAJ1THY3_9BACL|nr:putative ribonuclease toxin of YeeF-YezG toxin-antitoxin module [Croceifilum oryzae]